MDDPRKKVLCVDDEHEVVYRVKLFVEARYHIEIDTANDAITALEMLASKQYDALLTDINMPGMSGLDLAAEVMRKYPIMIVIIITGSADLETLARTKGARFLIKPVSLKEIQHVIWENFGMVEAKKT